MMITFPMQVASTAEGEKQPKDDKAEGNTEHEVKESYIVLMPICKGEKAVDFNGFRKKSCHNCRY